MEEVGSLELGPCFLGLEMRLLPGNPMEKEEAGSYSPCEINVLVRAAWLQGIGINGERSLSHAENAGHGSITKN